MEIRYPPLQMYFYTSFQIAIYKTSRVSDPQKLFYEAVRFFQIPPPQPQSLSRPHPKWEQIPVLAIRNLINWE